MTEYEKAEQDVAAAKVAERIAEWKAMEAKAAYYRYASESMAASAEVMGSRIRRDNALAAEFVEKANAVEQDWTPTVQPAEITVADLDKLATKASPEERAEIPEGYRPWNAYGSQPAGTKVNLWNGSEVITYVAGEDDVPIDYVILAFQVVERKTEPRLVPSSADDTPTDWTPFSSIEPNAPKEYAGFALETTYHDNVGEWVFRYRILEAPAPEQAVIAVSRTEPQEGDYFMTRRGFETMGADGLLHPLSPIPAPEQPASVDVLDEAAIATINDLWQQGYDDKANGYEPSLAEPEYTKGYEARALIEREHRETMERAKFFDGGMMADADRHAREQSMMEKAGEALAAIFKREREDA